MTAAREAAEQALIWQTGSLRVTAFYTGPLDIGAVKWWESLTGQQADSRNVRAGAGQLIELGTFEGQMLQLQIDLRRIDWLLRPKDDPENATFPMLGDFEKSSAYFADLVSKWFGQAPPLTRLAFGAQLLIPTANQPEAVQLMARILTYVTIKWEGVQDFVFQVNRPLVCATLPDLGIINRLAKWQTVVLKRISAILLPQPQTPVTTSEQTAAFCEVDISTADTSTTTLPREQLDALLAELIHHAADIVSKGDVI